MIEVKDLVYTYPKAKEPAVKGLSFSVREGEIFGFLGPSGAGKSTTQKIVIGILKGFSGSVSVNGTDMRGVKPDFYEHVGMAFELPNLYSKFTALENLSFFASLYSVRTVKPAELLAEVGLADDAGTRVSAFSKGMRVRLNLARALLHNPKLVFLDEPTSGLDPVNAHMVKDLILRRRNNGATVFLTTHNMAVASEICDTVAFIVDGKIALTDSPRNLMVEGGTRKVSVEYRENGTLRSDSFDLSGLGHDEEFLSLLRGKDIETIHTQEPSLEEIFIRETGRSLS